MERNKEVLQNSKKERQEEICEINSSLREIALEEIKQKTGVYICCVIRTGDDEYLVRKIVHEGCYYGVKRKRDKSWGVRSLYISGCFSGNYEVISDD